LYLLPVHTRVPLKFGAETLTSVTCARVCVTVADRQGRTATGWGETPLSVEWVWPSTLPYGVRHDALLSFTNELARKWADFDCCGHPLEIGYAFQQEFLDPVDGDDQAGSDYPALPLLARLLCCSPFDLALYDAFGELHGLPVFEMLTEEYLNHDLSYYLSPADDAAVNFRDKYPSDFLASARHEELPAWHLVGGLDPLVQSDCNGNQPEDEHPILLKDWIRRDGLTCLKIKLRGTDAQWDYSRLVNVGRVAAAGGVTHLTADFNCTVTDPSYVVDILDRLEREEPDIHRSILYIEQPFPYDLEENLIDVREVSRRKLLLMDESAHNWELVRLGRSLGWTGVALKTCKTLTGALLSLSWAKAHGMDIMVQDLTNPMLAQIPHLLLAAHTDTLLGVETNAMQFYPSASDIEAKVHPGVYQRRNGRVDLSTIRGPGFGYRTDEIARVLPEPVVSYGLTDAESSNGVPRPHIRVD
jgi:L-alanine-DL-glutamate epimerase-like enolase superfamily enzyme